MPNEKEVILMSDEEKFAERFACPKSKDGEHCDHWWDDAGPCHYCGDDISEGPCRETASEE